MPAPLETLLSYLNSGYVGQAADDSIIGHFGGDDLLKAAQQYDPNAHWQNVTNGDAGAGRSLVVDIEKLPGSKAGKAGYDLRASNFKESKYLKDPSKIAQDDVYGSVTNSSNFRDDQEAAWTKLAPLLVAALGPMAGAALAGAGIGGGAGLTAGVTGSGVTGSAPGWLTSLVKQGPSNARAISNGNFDVLRLLPAVGQAFGVSPSIVSGGSTLAQLARRRR